MASEDYNPGMTPVQRSFSRIGLWVGVVTLMLVITSRPKRSPGELSSLGTVRDMSFYGVTSSGAKPMRTTHLQGQPWVANFIFTRCGGPCPIMSTKMAALQRVLPKEVKLVSFTVDPDYDNAHVLQVYARRFHANPERWIFARASKNSLTKMVSKDFKLSDKLEMHSTKLVLVDQQNVVRAYYDSDGEAVFKDVARDVALLTTGKAPRPPHQ